MQPDQLRLQSAVDRHALLSVTDAEGRIVHVNDMFCTISQYSREELIGKNHRVLVSGFHPDSFYAEMWKTIAEGRVWKGRIRNRRKDRDFYWVLATIMPATGADGRPEQYICIATEITTFVYAQERLSRSKAMLRGIADTTTSGILLHRGGKLLYVNQAICTLTGFSEAELLASSYLTLVHPDSRPEVEARVAARLRGDPPPDGFEYRLSTKNDSTVWVEVKAGSIEYEGAPAVIATLADITDRRRAEAALRASQIELERTVEARTAQLKAAKEALEADVQHRAQTEKELLARNADLATLNDQLKKAQEQLLQSEKMASVGQLAAGVAHEINNPIGYVHSNLGSLEGYLEKLFGAIDAYERAEPAIRPDHPAAAELQRAKEGLDLQYLREDVPSLMKESKEGITRVRKIVQDLKDFSRVDSTQEWQWADLHQGLDSTLNIVANEIKYRAEVVRQYGQISEIECLPSQLNQVFMNLLVNAAHAIEGARGTITVATGRENEGSVWVSVADSGTGISKENLTRIFDPFFTTKPVGKGTGLGLSLSYGIVQKHGGRIEVASELGKGTTFRVVLPIRQRAEEKPLHEAAA